MIKIETRYIEILEAIKEYYKGNDNIIADCMVYIRNDLCLGDIVFSSKAQNWLEENNRCIYCGKELDETIINDMGEKRIITYCHSCTYGE